MVILSSIATMIINAAMHADTRPRCWLRYASVPSVSLSNRTWYPDSTSIPSSCRCVSFVSLFFVVRSSRWGGRGRGEHPTSSLHPKLYIQRPSSPPLSSINVPYPHRYPHLLPFFLIPVRWLRRGAACKRANERTETNAFRI